MLKFNTNFPTARRKYERAKNKFKIRWRAYFHAVCELAKRTRGARLMFSLVHWLQKLMKGPSAAGADFSSHFDLDNLVSLTSSLRNLK